MTPLSGTEWFSWQIVDLVGIAARKAMARYVALLDYVTNAETLKWQAAAGILAKLKAELNTLADKDSSDAAPHLYQAGDSLFDRVEAAIEPLRGDVELSAAVTKLPRSSVAMTPRAGNYLLYGVGTAALVALGYMWVKGK